VTVRGGHVERVAARLQYGNTPRFFWQAAGRRHDDRKLVVGQGEHETFPRRATMAASK
jgi:hypothetical protein